MVLDVTVIGAELSLKLEDLVDQIRTFLADTENSIIAYNSNVAKDDTELSDAERKRIAVIDASVADLQKQITDLSPDPAKISALSVKLGQLMNDLRQLYVQKDSLNVKLYQAIASKDAAAQATINQQISDVAAQIASKANEIVATQGQLNAEITKRPDPIKVAQLSVQISSLLNEKHRIYHMRPAALPKAIESLDNVLTTFNKQEQPRIDRILDNVPSTVQDVNRILNRVNEMEQPRIEKIMDEVPETLASARDVIVRFNTVEQPKIEDILDSVDDTIDDAGEVLTQVKGLFVTTRLEPVDPGKLSPDLKDKLDALQREHELAGQRLTKQGKVTGSLGSGIGLPVTQRQPVPVAFATDGAGGPAFTGNLYDNQSAYLRQVEREKLKVGKEIDRIRFRRVDTPGVIPQTLESLHDSLDEAHGILAKVNGALGGILGFAGKYSLFLKIGAGVCGVAVLATFILVPILLLKMLLFGL